MIRILFAFSMAASAQLPDDPGSRFNATALTQQGRLFTVRMVEGEPLRLFVAGKEEGKIDLKELKLSIRRLKPYPGQVLQMDLKGDHFVTANPEALKGAEALEVTAESKLGREKLQFLMNRKKP